MNLTRLISGKPGLISWIPSSQLKEQAKGGAKLNSSSVKKVVSLKKIFVFCFDFNAINLVDKQYNYWIFQTPKFVSILS